MTYFEEEDLWPIYRIQDPDNFMLLLFGHGNNLNVFRTKCWRSLYLCCMHHQTEYKGMTCAMSHAPKFETSARILTKTWVTLINCCVASIALCYTLQLGDWDLYHFLIMKWI